MPWQSGAASPGAPAGAFDVRCGVRLLTNPGSNLSPEQIARYDVMVLPQHIVVDGVVHDTRQPPSQEEVDFWTKTAKKWPETIGTTSAESVQALDQLLRGGERELLIITTSITPSMTIFSPMAS